MSGHASPAISDDDSYTVPVSAGIPTGVRFALVACVALAIFILGLVVYGSAENHVWPSSASLRVPLEGH